MEQPTINTDIPSADPNDHNTIPTTSERDGLNTVLESMATNMTDDTSNAIRMVEELTMRNHSYKVVGLLPLLFHAEQVKSGLIEPSRTIGAGANAAERDRATLPTLDSTALGPNQLSSRFQRRAKLLKDIGRGITQAEEVIATTAVGHPNRAAALSNLGKYFGDRYQELGVLEDLENSIERIEQALRETPADHTDHACRLDNLGWQLHLRYRRLGELKDLEMAIELGEQAVREIPGNHPDRTAILCNLGKHRGERYNHLGAFEDLESAIGWSEKALAATPENHPDHAAMLSNMSVNFGNRYHQLGVIEDLQKAIELGAQALRETPQDQYDWVCRLDRLGMYLASRFDRLGALKDLEMAIEWSKHALDATPAGHLDRASRLDRIGNNYDRRYHRLGILEDLEKAIERGEQALEATPTEHPDRASMLANLASYLSARYSQLGALEDTEKAIKLGEQALETTPGNHPSHPRRLSQLGGYLANRYNRLMRLEDLEKAIELDQRALEATPASDPGIADILYNLSYHLGRRYLQLGAFEDLEKAIKRGEEAIETTPTNHPDRANRLNNLCIHVSMRYERLRAFEDSEKAIKCGEEAIRSLPSDHPQLGIILHNLSSLLVSRISHSFDDIDYLLRISLKAWSSNASPPTLRVIAARRAAVIFSTLERWPESSFLLKGAVKLLPKVSPRLLDLDDQQHKLSQFTQLASSTVAAALQAGSEASECLSLLELSRGIIMGLVIDCRSSLSELHKQHPDIYGRFNHLRAEIDSPQKFGKSGAIDTLGDNKKHTSEDQRRQRKKDIDELDELLTSIRNLPGFAGFLLPPSTEELIKMAKEGPIVILNCTDVRSDAIIVTTSATKLLPLPKLEFDEVTRRMEHLNRKLIRGKSRTYPLRNAGMEELLLWLWNVAIAPVCEELQLHPTVNDSTLPRVWWIGVGPLSMAPFHAAGDHSPGSTQNTLCRAISSYIPTIKALSYAREMKLGLLTKDSSLLLVTMPQTPKHSPLSSAYEEVRFIKSVVKKGTTTELLDSPSAGEVLEKLQYHDAVHFTCHGVSTGKHPSGSHLLLCKNGDPGSELAIDKLTAGSISRVNIKHAQIAYLSACSTARNDSTQLADEPIHIASSFLLAGFSHVLATLWESNDGACLQVSSEFYRLIFDNGAVGGDGGHRKVGMAFHQAVRKLRDGNWRQPLRWASFIHTGA